MRADGVDERYITGGAAQEVRDLSVKKLAEPGMGARGIIRQSNAAMVGTIDDPTSDLAWHRTTPSPPWYD